MTKEVAKPVANAASAVGQGSKAVTQTVIAPAVEVVSPSAAQKITETSNNFVSWGNQANKAITVVADDPVRFTALAANETAKALHDAATEPDGFIRVAGEAMRESVTKDGVVTNIVQDYVPGGGFVTAIFHAAAGNEDYAQYAAVKGASSTIVAGAAVAGTVIGGPGGAIAGGAAGAAGAMAFEGAMKNLMEPSVRDKLPDLTIENVVVAGVIGGIAGGAGYAGGKALAAGGGKLSSLVGMSRTPTPRPPSSLAVRIGKGYAVKAGVGVGIGVVAEVANAYRVPEFAESAAMGFLGEATKRASGPAAVAAGAAAVAAASATHLANDIKEEAERDRPAVLPPIVRRPSNNRRRIAIGAGAAILLLGGGFGLTQLLGGGSDDTESVAAGEEPASPSTTADSGDTSLEVSTTATTDGDDTATSETTATTGSTSAEATSTTTRSSTTRSATTARSTSSSSAVSSTTAAPTTASTTAPTTASTTTTSTTTSTTASQENRTPSMSNPGEQSTIAGDSVSLSINASDSDGDGLTYSASGLPTGLSINSGTGLISGTVSTNADFDNTVTVTVADDGSPSRSTQVTFAWSIGFP